jgi:hypothetical protein
MHASPVGDGWRVRKDGLIRKDGLVGEDRPIEDDGLVGRCRRESGRVR